MLTDILEVRVALLLLLLCFIRSLVSVYPLVNRLRLEGVLVGDLGRPLQTQLNFQVLANQLSERLVLQDVELGGFVKVEDFERDRVVLHAVLDTLGVDNGRFVLRGIDKVEKRKQEDVDITDLVPAVGKVPTEGFAFVLLVLGWWLEATLFVLFVQLFDIEVDVVSEGVTGDDASVFFVGAILVDLDHDFGNLGTVTLNFGRNFRLVIDLFFTDFTANCVSLSNNWHDFLELDIDLTELLKSLLVIKLVTHLSLQLFLSLALILLKLLLLLLHLERELSLLSFKLLHGLLTIVAC